MRIDKLNDEWIFQGHPEDRVRRWVSSLRYFYFVRAAGGHANDGDRFLASFHYSSREDLLGKLKCLHIIIPAIIPPDAPHRVPGQSYTGEESSRFRSAMDRFPDLEQPKHVAIDGSKCFVWVHETTFDIAVSGTADDNLYEVSEADIELCKKLEILFESAGFDTARDEGIETNTCCVSRSRYPHLFETRMG